MNAHRLPAASPVSARRLGRAVAPTKAPGRKPMLRPFLKWCERQLWPNKPRPVEFFGRIDAVALLAKWCEVMHFAANGNVCTPADDEAELLIAAQSMLELLEDYRAGRAQTPAEMLLAHGLDHVAKQYLGA